MKNKATERAVEDLTKITSTIEAVVVDIESDTLVAAPVKNILEMITSRINASIQALQAEPQQVDVEIIVDGSNTTDAIEYIIDGVENVMRETHDVDASDNTYAANVVGWLIEQGYLQTQPEPIDGLDEALLCGKHPQQAQQFKAKYSKNYYDVVQDAAKAHAELTKGKGDE